MSSETPEESKSKVNRLTWLNFKNNHVRVFMHVLNASKFDDDLIEMNALARIHYFPIISL